MPRRSALWRVGLEYAAGDLDERLRGDWDNSKEYISAGDASAEVVMEFVGKAANGMVKECLEQFPKIVGPEDVVLDHGKGVGITSEASPRERLAPGAPAFLAPAGRRAGLREGSPRRSVLWRAGLECAAGVL